MEGAAAEGEITGTVRPDSEVRVKEAAREREIAPHTHEACMPGEIPDPGNYMLQAILDRTPALIFIKDRASRYDLISGARVD